MATTRPEIDVSGQCACGGVTLSVTGPVRSMLLCSCEDCQRATGTGHSTIAIVDADDVRVAGNVRSFAVTADSGATLTRHFCPTCGTPLYGRSSRWANALMLAVGFFGATSSWYHPTQVIFTRSHRDWDALPGPLPQYDAYRPKGD